MGFFQYSTSTPFNIKLVLAYDGSDFFGWQETFEGQTIEGSLRKILQDILQENIQLQAASRTDAGVHAEGQVVHFFTQKKLDLERLQKSLNALLPATIRVMDVENKELSFHPTLDNIGKEYHYHVYHGKILPPKERITCWHIYKELSLDLMEMAIPAFLGKKDFSAFCNVSNIEKANKEAHLFEISLISESRCKLKIVVRGDNFLYKMVRNIVGTLISVGKNEIAVQSIPLLFEKKDRKLAAMTAPAHGLTLMKIFYPESL